MSRNNQGGYQQGGYQGYQQGGGGYQQQTGYQQQQQNPYGNQQQGGYQQQRPQNPYGGQQNPYGGQQNPYGGNQQQYPPQRPQQQQRPQQPPPGIDPTLWGWFQAVDQDRSGSITAEELQKALLNNNWSHFNAETCRLMIGMFDKNRSGTIDIYEFAALWKYVQDWKQCFDGFDRDRSGTIDEQELQQAFTTFGYRLTPQFSHLCVRVFDRHNVKTMKFDDFIQCCVMLKTLTDAFRKYDTNQSGVININYEQFLEMVLDNTLSGI